MKHKINLTNYVVKGQGSGPQGDDQDYDVKDIIPKIVLHPTLKHNGFRFYTISKVANRIKNCKEDSILLEKADYEIVKEAFSKFEGFGAGDTELVTRIFEAEEVQ